MSEKNTKKNFEPFIRNIIRDTDKVTFISQFFSNPLYYIGGLVATGIAALGIGVGIGSAISGSQSEREMLLQKKVEECSVGLEKKEKEIQRLSVYEKKTAELEEMNAQARKGLNDSASNYKRLQAEKASAERQSQEKAGQLQTRINRLEKDNESRQKDIDQLKKQNEEAKKRIESLSKDTFREYFNEGVAALEYGDLEKAKEVLGKAIFFKPADPSVHYFLGKCLERADELDNAAHEYKNVLSVDPAFTAAKTALDAVNKRIADIKERNSLEGQIRSLEAQIEQNPKQEVLYLELGKKFIQKDEKAKALGILEKGMEIKPSESKPLQELYIQTVSTIEELNRAISFYEESRNASLKVKNKPAVSELFVRLGRMKSEANDLEEAIKAFEKAINYNPSWAVPQFEYGCALMKQAGNNISGQKFAEINKYFMLAIQYDTKWAEPYLGMARLRRKSNLSSETNIIGFYETTVRLDPSGIAPLECVEFISSKQPAKLGYAKALLRDLIQIHPKSASLKLALSDAYMGLKEWHNAILVLEQVDPKDISLPGTLTHLEISYRMGICCKERNLTDLAKTNFEKANKTFAAHDARAELEKISQSELSLNLWKNNTSPEEKKSQERTDYDRARKFFENKEFNSALWLLDRHDNSSSSDIHMLKGQTYMAVGKFQEAKDSFKTAEKLEENKAKKALVCFEKNVLRYYLEREADLYSIANKTNRDSFDIEKTLFELWNEAYKILPENVRVKNRKSELAAALGMRYKVMGDLDKSLEFYAQDEIGKFSLKEIAKIKEEKGNLEEAVSSYKKFIEASRGSASSDFYDAKAKFIVLSKIIGKRKIAEGKAFDAIDYLRDVFWENKCLSNRYDLAVAFKEAKMLDSAEEHFRVIAGSRFLDEDDLKLREKSYIELGMMYKEKNPSEARDFFKGATRCNSENVEAFMHFGELSMQLNDPKKAKWAYEAAAGLGNEEAKNKLNEIK